MKKPTSLHITPSKTAISHTFHRKANTKHTHHTSHTKHTHEIITTVQTTHLQVGKSRPESIISVQSDPHRLLTHRYPYLRFLIQTLPSMSISRSIFISAHIHHNKVPILHCTLVRMRGPNNRPLYSIDSSAEKVPHVIHPSRIPLVICRRRLKGLYYMQHVRKASPQHPAKGRQASKRRKRSPVSRRRLWRQSGKCRPR
jgi:hypothetical protein